MKRLKSIILGAFFASSAFAQAPSPTQIGTLKTTNPYPVSILYNNTWYPMGSVNTTLNIFTLPVGNLVNGTTPFLTATNTFTNLQTYSSGIAIGGSTGVISIKNPSASVAYNFNLPATSGSANAPLLSGGGSSSPMTWGTRSGSTTAFATVSGSLTGGNCVSIDSSGNLVDAGGPCSTGGGGGTVSSGHTGELAFYAATGTTVTGNTNAIMTSGKLTLGIAGSSQGSVALSGSTSGTTTLAAPTTASGTMTLPAATDTIVGKNTTDIFTNKTIDTAGPNTIRVNGTSLTSVTGTGNVVLSTSPTFITPILGTPTSATLTNATGLPVSTGLAGAGTGVVTALGVATNTANGLLTLGAGATVPVLRGGTGIASGTSGAIPYFSSTSTIASSALLTQYGVMYGGGPGAAPATTAAGTSGHVLSGNGASSAPTFNSLTSLLDSNFSSSQGSILYRGASGWASLAPGTSGQFLKTQGASANPVWAASSSGITGFYNLSDYISGCTSTNYAPCIQAAINAAYNSGTSPTGGIVWIPPGVWPVTSQIIVYPNVILSGASEEQFPNTNASTVPPNITQGSVIQVNWGSGAGSSIDSTKSAILLKSNTTVRNLVFDYPGQSVSSSTPTEYGATISLGDGNGNWNQNILSNMFYKSYAAIDASGSHIFGVGVSNLTISNNKIIAIKYGIEADWIVDWSTIANNTLNAGAIWTGDPSPSSHLIGWIASNGIAVIVRQADWVILNNIQAFGYSTGVYFNLANTYHPYIGSGPYTVVNSQFDACNTGIYMDGTFNHPVRIFQSAFFPFNSVTSSSGAGVSLASGTVLQGFQYIGNFVTFPYAPGTMVWLAQPSQTVNQVMITNNLTAGVTSSSTSAVSISGANNVIVTNNIFPNYTSASKVICSSCGANVITGNL